MTTEEGPKLLSLKRLLKHLWERQFTKDKTAFKTTFLWFLEKGKERGFLSEEDLKIISRALNFGQKTTKEIMVPIPEVVAAEINTSIPQLVKLIIEKGHTRIPIYQDNLDNIVGILHAKNLLKLLITNKQPPSLKGILHPPLFVPETQKIGVLLNKMNIHHMHLAIVVDEYGSTVGIVSLEDIVEEIFGEIQDEYDKESTKLLKIGSNKWKVKANIDLETLEEQIGISFPEGKYETLAGFLINLWGRVPRKGERILYDNIEFQIIRATPKKIQEVLLIKKTKQQGRNQVVSA